MNKLYAKAVHLHVGSPALGGKLSLMSSKTSTLEIKPEGVLAISTGTKRAVLIPYSNIVDCEVIYDCVIPVLATAPQKSIANKEAKA